MFGNFDTSWASGFNPLNQINETLQKMKTDIEQNLESSLGLPGLSGAGDSSSKTEDFVSTSSEVPAAQAETSSSVTFFPATFGGLLNSGAPIPPPAQPPSTPPDTNGEDPGDKSSEPATISTLDPGPLANEKPAQQVLGGDGLDGWGDDNLELELTPASSPEKEQKEPASAREAGLGIEAAADGHEPPVATTEPEMEAAIKDVEAAAIVEVEEVPRSVSGDFSGLPQPPPAIVADGVAVQEEPEGTTEGLQAVLPSTIDQGADEPVTPSRLGMFAPASMQAGLGDNSAAGQEEETTAESHQEPEQQHGSRGDVQEAMANGTFHGDLSLVDVERDSALEAVQGFQEQALEEAGPDEEGPSPRGGGGAVSEAGSMENAPESVASAASHSGHLPHVTSRQAFGHVGGVEVDVTTLDTEQLRVMAIELRTVLRAREEQMERMLEESASLREVAKQLQEKNAELAMKAHKVSEEDLESMRAEFEERLGAAERKVYVLTKERDALRRGSEKLSASNDLLKEKDTIIQQVMAEGEKLSKKQLTQESLIKKLRQEIQDLIVAKSSVSTTLVNERQRADTATAAKTKLEADLAALRQAHRAEMEAEKAHHEALLQKSRAAQVEAEEKARVSAKEGLGKKLKEAEARAESLADTVEQLQASLERQRAASDLREGLLKKEVADLERRWQAAQSRTEELASTVPEATRPLLRQLEAMQAAAAGQQEAWLAAERNLTLRLQDADATAAAAVERERLAADRLAAANTRATSAAAALEEVRSRLTEVQAQADQEHQERLAAEAKTRSVADQLRQAEARYEAEMKAREAAESMAEEALQVERRNHMALLRTAESRIAELEKQVPAASSLLPSLSLPSVPQPPAMPAPGYKWVLEKENDEGPDSPMSGQSSVREALAGLGLPPPRSSLVEVQRLRDLLRQKEEQLNSLHQHLSGLEATRDSLAEELLRAAQAAEAANQAQRDLAVARRECEEWRLKMAACTELLGERDERLGELEADVHDVKALYRDQIEFMVERLALLEAAEQRRIAAENTLPISMPPSSFDENA